MQYGSFADHNANSQADPLESQREVEALQRVVARTSKYVYPAGLRPQCDGIIDY